VAINTLKESPEGCLFIELGMRRDFSNRFGEGKPKLAV